MEYGLNLLLDSDGLKSCRTRQNRNRNATSGLQESPNYIFVADSMHVSLFTFGQLAPKFFTKYTGMQTYQPENMIWDIMAIQDRLKSSVSGLVETIEWLQDCMLPTYLAYVSEGSEGMATKNTKNR